MKKLLLASLTALLAVTANATPLRVLYCGTEDRAARMTCHALMRDLGRDAIWFEYAASPAAVTPEFVAKFDAVVLDAPAANYPTLKAVPAAKLLQAATLGDAAAADFASSAKPKFLAAAGAKRVGEWEKFLAQRDPEKREASPTVANYEKRAQPLTFQHPFSVKGSRERTQVAPDLRFELFASEPNIGKPIAFAWDERGRCWVAETRDYPHNVQADGLGNDRITICEDTDGDGRADKFTVFADKLNIPTSLVFANGGVIVAQSPRFLFLKDTNGDDKADERRELMTGWGIRDTHAQASSFHYGHDNWIYGCVGYSGFDGEVGGKALKFGMGTYRFKADGSALEFLHQFSNNSWGHGANEFGDQFGGTANNAPLFFGGIPANLVPRGLRVMSAKRINVEDKCHTITPNFRQVDVMGGYTAAAGSALIHSGNLPARLQGKALICEPTMKTVSLLDVQRDGAGYTAKDGFNLVASSDEWMSPVFAEVGPDGAVWVADFQNFIIQHNPTPSASRGGYDAKTGVGGAHENVLRDQTRGRIYRVVWEQAKKPAITSLKGAAPAQLVAALGNDNPFWRLTAQRLLVESKATAVAPALKQAATNSAPLAALHSLWTLHGLGQLDDATHRAALSHKDAAVRRNATRALGRDARAVSLFFSSGVVSDADLLTRLAGFVKLAEFATTKEIQTVAGSIAKNPVVLTNEWLQEASRLLARIHQVEAYKEGPNLLPNPGFEVIGSNGLPEGWTRRDYGGRAANKEVEWKVVTDAKAFRSGKQAVRCVSPGDADTSLYADVTLKPNTQYRLSGWVKTRALVSGKVSLNDHIGRVETERVTRREADWTEVDATFNSGDRTKASINILHVAKGDGFWDDVKLVELLPVEDATKAIVADAKRGAEIFHKHAAACVLCHSLKGQGSTVGPALDGIAARKDLAYLRQSLLEPSAVIADGFKDPNATAKSPQLSPMPPMGDIFSPQEIADILAFVATLK